MQICVPVRCNSFSFFAPPALKLSPTRGKIVSDLPVHSTELCSLVPSLTNSNMVLAQLHEPSAGSLTTTVADAVLVSLAPFRSGP